MGPVRAALSFLTVIPIPGQPGEPGPHLGRAYFPIVGTLLGLVAAAVFSLVGAVASHELAAVAAVATLAILSGGLHLDGLADAADGLLGGSTPQRRLQIMRDPRVGSFGLIALVLLIAAEVMVLASLSSGRALAALIVAGAFSRWALLPMIAILPNARPSGMGQAARGTRTAIDLTAGTALAALVLLLDWRRGLLAAALVIATAGLVAILAWRRIGGATGDVYGATAELCQLAALTAFAVHI